MVAARFLFLLGTCHKTAGSCNQVWMLIRALQPTVVLAELCPRRLRVAGTWPVELSSEELRQLPFFSLWSRMAEASPSVERSEARYTPMDSRKDLVKEFFRDLLIRGPQASSEMTVLLAEAERINASVVLGDRDVDLTLKRAQRSVTLTSAVSQVAYVAGLVVMAPAWGDLDRELRSIRQELMPKASEDLLLRADSLGWQLHQDVHRYSVVELISWALDLEFSALNFNTRAERVLQGIAAWTARGPFSYALGLMKSLFWKKWGSSTRPGDGVLVDETSSTMVAGSFASRPPTSPTFARPLVAWPKAVSTVLVADAGRFAAVGGTARCSLGLLQLDDDENGEPTAWGDASHGGRFTGGTCSLFGCDSSRGPTICHHFRCICQEGYVAMAGKCEPSSAGPVTALGTRTGESCSWLGYCTVEHSACKSLRLLPRQNTRGQRLSASACPVEEKPLSHSPRTKALLPEAAECSEVVQQLDRRSHPWPQTERARACRALTSKRGRHHQATLSSLLMTRAGRRSVRHGRISAGSEESSSALQEVERTLLAKNDNYDKAPTEQPPPYDAPVGTAGNNSDDEDYVKGQTFTSSTTNTTTSITTTQTAVSAGSTNSSKSSNATTTAAPSSTSSAGASKSNSTATTTPAATPKSNSTATTTVAASTSTANGGANSTTKSTCLRPFTTPYGTFEQQAIIAADV
eukprot:s41_g8.t4